jgi:intraflagellar transport protein 52
MLPGKQFNITKSHLRAADIPTKQLVPDIASLSSQVRGCLEDAEELPADITSLFDKDMFAFDLSAVPDAIQLFHRLGVPKKPLTLIEPQFELPLPPLNAAVFPPAIFEPAQPALERFDLDDAFANEYFKLSQLSLVARKREQKHDAAALEDYVTKAAQAIGLKAKHMSAQQALLEVFDQVAKWKLQDANAGSPTHWGQYDTEEGIRI